MQEATPQTAPHVTSPAKLRHWFIADRLDAAAPIIDARIHKGELPAAARPELLRLVAHVSATRYAGDQAQTDAAVAAARARVQALRLP